MVLYYKYIILNINIAIYKYKLIKGRYMEDKDRSKKQLIVELNRLRKRADKSKSTEVIPKSEKNPSDQKKALKESESKYRKLLDNLKSGVAVYEAIDNGNDFIFKDANKALEKIEKVKKKEIIGHSVKKIFPGVVEFGLFDILKKVYSTGKPQKHPVTLYKDDRLIGWRENYIYKLGTGEIVSVYEDLSKDRQQQERLENLNRVLSTVRNINQLITKEKDKTKLIKKACKIFLKNHGYNSAWIILIDKHKKLIESAEAGVGEDFQILIEEIKNNKLPACWKKAMASSKTIINRDPANDCKDCPLSDDYDGNSTMTIRLKYDKKVCGLLSVSTSIGYMKDKEEQGLFEEAAGDISFALHSMDVREKQKEALKKLEESEHRFERLAKSAKEGIFFHEKGMILDANKAAADMAGVKVADLIGKSTYDFLDPVSREKAKEMAEKGSREQYEIKFKRSDGKTFDVEIIGGPTYYDGKKVRAAVFRDITKRKKAEKKLKESEDRYRSLYLSMNEGVCLHEVIYDKNKKPVDYVILDVNDAYEKILELKRDQVIGKKATEAYGIKDAPYIDIYEKVARTGKSIIFEIYFAPIGKYFDISVFSYEKGKFVTVFTDTTKRQKTEKKLSESYLKLQRATKTIMDTLTSIIEIRDPYTAGHQRRVSVLVIAIAEELGMDKNRIEALGTAAMVHDIGKINIPASILSKPGRLSDIEMEMIRTHSQLGCDMLKKMDSFWPINNTILQHHERMDGSGYPNGLKGKNISLEGKILAVADVVEAMSSHRPYRPALGLKKALKEIKTNRGTLYDSKVVDICIRLFDKEKFNFNHLPLEYSNISPP